jgi:hypothetical protein
MVRDRTEYHRQYREKNKDKIKEYREQNKDKMKEYRQTPEGIKSHRITQWKHRNVIHYDFDLLHDVIYTLTSHCDYCGVYLEGNGSNRKCLHHLHISNVKDNVEAIVCNSCNVKAG